MESIGESTKSTSELIEICEKVLENGGYGDMKTLQRTLDYAFRQKEAQGMKQRDGDSILPMAVDLGKAVDSLIVRLKEASGRSEKMDVDSPGNVLVTQEFSRPGESPAIYYSRREESGIKLRRKVKELETRRVDLLTKMTSEFTSGKILKTEFQLWLVNVDKIVKKAEKLETTLAEGRFNEYEALARILMGEIEELDEMYTKGTLAESLASEDNAGEEKQSYSQAKTKKKGSSSVGNNGGKISIVGMGGVGETRIENNSPVNISYGNIQL